MQARIQGPQAAPSPYLPKILEIDRNIFKFKIGKIFEIYREF
jgi:hypothetical protein